MGDHRFAWRLKLEVSAWWREGNEQFVMLDELRLIFFFQAEDGIRDIGVTGVQTCALPI